MLGSRGRRLFASGGRTAVAVTTRLPQMAEPRRMFRFVGIAPEGRKTVSVVVKSSTHFLGRFHPERARRLSLACAPVSRMPFDPARTARLRACAARYIAVSSNGPVFGLARAVAAARPL